MTILNISFSTYGGIYMTVNKIYILVINWYFNSSQMKSYHAHSTLRDEKQPSVISVIRIHIGVF